MLPNIKEKRVEKKHRFNFSLVIAYRFFPVGKISNYSLINGKKSFCCFQVPVVNYY